MRSFLLVGATCTVSFVVGDVLREHVARQVQVGPIGGSATTGASDTALPVSGTVASTGGVTSASQPADTSAAATTQPPAPTPTPTPTPTPDPGSSVSSPPIDSQTPSPPPGTSAASSTAVTVLPGGETITEVVTASGSGTLSSSSSSASPTNTAAPSGSSSVSKGTIVGLSVAGGIALLGLIAFIIWKVTRKRFSEFDHDGEEIKWPELNNEIHALPTRTTGRAGIDDDGDEMGGPNGSPRDPSLYGAAPSTAGASMADLHPYNDPYAVPPLPHLNPNQPYRDDPSGAGGYYDPYRGPVPQSLHDPSDGTESIPLSTYSATSGSANYSTQNQPQQYERFDGVRSPDNGRVSPGPAMAYNAGRQSPGPAVGYGGAARTQSPAPLAGYGAGRQSPGPAAAYDDYRH